MAGISGKDLLAVIGLLSILLLFASFKLSAGAKKMAELNKEFAEITEEVVDLREIVFNKSVALATVHGELDDALDSVKRGGILVKTSYEMVKEFHEKFGAPVGAKPSLIDRDRAILRISLIEEELEELKSSIDDGDIVEIADALADLKYVTDGTAVEYGIPLDECTKEVHRSNMSKLGPDGKPILREDGKILKPSGWTPPNLKPILGVEVNSQRNES